MLSQEEKREMLEDSKSKKRRDNFRIARNQNVGNFSFDDYLYFLNQVQIIFSPFKVLRYKTITKLNKL